jgi:pullulanase
MIQSLHNEKISVIMDVVYNHTYKTFLSNFEKIVPNYYYRQKDNGEKSNGSGCNNDTASERRMVHNFIVNSVLFWAKEYHIDGFRFDLMGLHDLDLMNDIRNQLNEKIEKGNEIIIYGEPWTMNTHISLKGFNKPMADKNNIDLFPNGISFFHDEFRDIVKGNTFNKTEKGFVSGSLIYANNNEYEKILEEFKYYFIGGINVNGKKEIVKNSKLINYLSCHDNNTLWDKLVIVENDLQEIKYKSEDNNVILTREIEKDNIKIIPKELKSFNDNDQNIFLKRDEIVIKKNKLAAAILMFSFGVPFFQAGEEGARTKLGEGNSYNLSKSLNQIDWERMYKFEDLINYYKKVIKIRKKLLNFYELNRAKYSNIDGLPKGIVGFHIQRIKYGKYKEIILIFNSTQNDYTYKIKGNSKWKIILSEDIKNKYVENREFTIYKISTGLIGNKDLNYKNNK